MSGKSTALASFDPRAKAERLEDFVAGKTGKGGGERQSKSGRLAPGNKRTTIDISSTLHRELKLQALKQGVSFGQLCIRYLENGLVEDVDRLGDTSGHR